MSDKTLIERLQFESATLPEDLAKLLDEEVIVLRTLPEEAIIYSMARMLERLQWNYDAACATLGTRDNEIEKLEQRIAELEEQLSQAVMTGGYHD